MLTKKDKTIEKKIDLYAFKRGLSFEFDYLHNYVTLMNSSVNERVDEFESKIISSLDNSQDESSQIDEMFFNETSKIKSYFYNSLIVMVYTVYESTLNKICVELNSNVKSKLDHENLNDRNAAKKFLLYLNLIADIDYLKDKKSHDRITEFQKLRNQIAHQNSTIKGKSEQDKKKNAIALKATFNRTENAIIVNEVTWDFYVDSISLVVEFIQVVRDYLFDIINMLEEKIFLIADE